ncbi:hypothetical protein [Coxiella-like endosymbiont]|uniref:hypothetical protein n=1 Tax=Coxiella-like endosymbiont TaxID=1592897 RepID=UPI00272D4A4B|nr:hypothetical protein [Coxiella-like endosymbiont]
MNATGSQPTGHTQPIFIGIPLVNSRIEDKNYSMSGEDYFVFCTSFENTDLAAKYPWEASFHAVFVSDSQIGIAFINYCDPIINNPADTTIY